MSNVSVSYHITSLAVRSHLSYDCGCRRNCGHHNWDGHKVPAEHSLAMVDDFACSSRPDYCGTLQCTCHATNTLLWDIGCKTRCNGLQIKKYTYLLPLFVIIKSLKPTLRKHTHITLRFVIKLLFSKIQMLSHSTY